MLSSAKNSSFINGVGLMLAASSRSDEALQQADRIRSFYDALARAPIPTIAAIRGNCYGCGVELALACDLRIAEDTPATRFRMPEVTDYRFMPLFGGTQRLPAAVGTEAAIDLIVFGAHVRAREAQRLGLVDVVAPRGSLDAAVEAELHALARNGFAKPPPRVAPPLDARAVKRVRARIATLPPAERPLAQAALKLSRLPTGDSYRFESGMAAELEAFRASVGSPAAAAAMGFFFVQQSAKLHTIGTSDYGAPLGVRAEVVGRTPPLRALAALLTPQAEGREVLTLVAEGKRGVCAVATGRGAAPEDVRRAGPIAAAHLPLPSAPMPPIELAVSDPADAARVRSLFLVLEDAGLQPVVTYARGSFLSDRMLDALAPAARARPSALSRFGFAPRAILAAAARRAKGPADPLSALAVVAVRALAAGEVAHPALLDLMARDVAGFPVWRGSLLRHLDALGPAALRKRLGREVAALLPAALQGRAGFYRP